MQCNRYINDLSLAPSSWEPVNRISFSSIARCSLRQNDAPTYSIKYVNKGTEHYFLDGRKYSVSAGKYLIVNSGQSLDVEVLSKTNVNGFCAHFKPAFLHAVYHDLFHGEDELLESIEPGNLPAFQSLIYQEKENALGDCMVNIARLFDQNTGELHLDEHTLFYHLASELIKVQHHLPRHERQLHVLKNSTRKELVSRLAIAKKFMDAPGGTDLSIEEIARTAMFSSSHFFRVFKKYYGTSPHQYQINKKMKKANALLLSKKYSVTEVAMECGFADLPSFTHQYKKIFKVAPSKILGD
ncbi:MAG: helix-turn-helix domain-containing protein [Flavitalea sp.]